MHRLFVALGFSCSLGCGNSVELDQEEAIAKGDALAQEAFAALSGRLQQAMEQGGPVHAVEYCSVAALPIADSLSALHGVRIKRTSDRIRAPHDRPDAFELEQLNNALRKIAAGTPPVELPAQVVVLGDSIAYYKPIVIASPTCLKCHGTVGREVDHATYAVIRERYPEDAAIGYELGDFRGSWSIRWPR